ncbi:MAG: hypothetical protein AAF788_02625 [Pseudomonadota bacterium]
MSGPPAVPETGAYSVKYLTIDGDYYLKIQKTGLAQRLVQTRQEHPEREGFTRADWDLYADRLFPQDEIDFDALRRLRGPDLIPAGLVSPLPGAVPACAAFEDLTYAKRQHRLIRKAPRSQPHDAVTMVTECFLHPGLTASQYGGIHKRPNPYRFPTRYDTMIDLDRNGRSEIVNVRMRNVSKAVVLDFLKRETNLRRRTRRGIATALERM